MNNRRRSKAPRRVYKKKVSSSGSFAKRVKKVITGFAEKKQTTTCQVNSSITTADTSVLISYIPLCPSISQTAAENGRVGNQIRVSYGQIAGYINMLPQSLNNTFANLKVRLFLVSMKNRNTTTSFNESLTTADLQTFFDNGANGVPFQGTMFDILSEVNKEQWTLHAQKTLTLSLGGSNTTYPITTSPISGSGSYQQFFKFNYGKHLGKLIYNDSVGSQFPTNKNLYLFMQAVSSDGSSRQAGPVAEAHYKIDTRYTDI